MDRQSLLEQKRQRLQQLKLRRAPLEPKLENTPPEVKRVDAAVQVNAAVQVTVQPLEPERTTFNKAIQVDLQREDDKQREEFQQREEIQQKEEDVQEAIVPQTDTELDPTLMDSLTRLNRVLAADPKLPALFAQFTKTLPEKTETSDSAFAETLALQPIDGRSVVAMDARDDVIAVAYSKPVAAGGIRASGLVVVHSLEADRVFPEYFLETTSPVTVVLLDESLQKVIGGLEDGSVVVWDLAGAEPTAITLLPSLKTQLFPSGTAHVRHSDAVVGLFPLNSGRVLSVSRDGIINVWSSNFLALPDLNSIRLESAERTFFSNSIPIECSVLLPQSETPSITSHAPEYAFLNGVVVALSSGALYKLHNDALTGYIHSILSAPKEPLKPLSMAHLEPNLIVTSHINWTLHLWSLDKTSPKHVIPTSTIVTHLAARPNHELQFIAVGSVDGTSIGPVVQLWDLTKSLMNPIDQLKLLGTFATTCIFNANGFQVVVGFNDASVRFFSIDDSLLKPAFVDAGIQ